MGRQLHSTRCVGFVPSRLFPTLLVGAFGQAAAAALYLSLSDAKRWSGGAVHVRTMSRKRMLRTQLQRNIDIQGRGGTISLCVRVDEDGVSMSRVPSKCILAYVSGTRRE